ncbi:MAG TPA: hypothetical protein VIK11_09240 [Tepidiformaceae bacterium]
MANRANVPLLESQKNDVFQLVRRYGFDPGQFEWHVTTVPGGYTVDRLDHRSPRDYFFAFDIIPNRDSYLAGLEDDRKSYFSPGPEQARAAGTCYGWTAQLGHVEMWLSALRREVDTVSLWDTLGSETTRLMAEANLSNRSLTKDERQLIEVQAQQVRAFLRANVDDHETLARVEKKVDELVDASKRLGIKDYAMVSLSLLLTMAVQAAFTGQQAQELVNLFYKGARLLLGQ